MRKRKIQISPISPESRLVALRAGIRIEILAIAWMTLESIVAVGSGMIADSVLLIAFGLDSIIELISGAVLLWRLSEEMKGDDLERIEQVERKATWISAVLLALLCLYVTFTTIVGLLRHVKPESSFSGIFISSAAMIVMPLLARRKRGLNKQLGSAALRADIAESVTCGYMAGTVLIGLVLSTTFGYWWAEYVASALFLYWLARETREAIAAARERAGAEG